MVGYGHAGDGNVHLNVSWEGRGAGWEEVEAVLEPWVYEETLRRGGSVSAEHGVGQAKVGWVGTQRGGGVEGMMRGVKRVLDPVGIMNPGKMV